MRVSTAFSKPKISAYRVIGTNLWKFLKVFWTKFDSAPMTHIAKAYYAYHSQKKFITKVLKYV